MIKGIVYTAKRILGNLYVRFRIKSISIEVAELFFQHNGEYDFKRYDMIVRLLAVENYFGKNDFGFNLYRRMQAARVNRDWEDPAVERFHKLIKSYDNRGYDTTSPIILDKNLHLIDGSHRMALAMYYHTKQINAIVKPITFNTFYGIEWFKINGFTNDECNKMIAKYEELKNYYSTPFICTLWNPINAYYDDITKKLGLFGDIREVLDFELTKDEYVFYTKGIYSVDDIEKWKIEKKLEHMQVYDKGLNKLRMVALSLKCPNFRLKDKTNTSLSQQCELIKQMIRDRYKDRIDNYFHDIIVHIGDNFTQNRFIYSLLKMPNINLTEILDDLRDLKYVIVKYEVPYMPTDFPIHYALGKDLDIVCSGKEEYDKVLSCLQYRLRNYRKYYNIRVIEEKDSSGCEYRTLFRLEQENNFLVFQFDISSTLLTDINSSAFTKEIIDTRKKLSVFYIPSEKYELIIRLLELHQNPEKQHHLEYINNHSNSLDSELCDKYLLFNWRDLCYQEKSN